MKFICHFIAPCCDNNCQNGVDPWESLKASFVALHMIKFCDPSLDLNVSSLFMRYRILLVFIIYSLLIVLLKSSLFLLTFLSGFCLIHLFQDYMRKSLFQLLTYLFLSVVLSLMALYLLSLYYKRDILIITFSWLSFLLPSLCLLWRFSY